VSGELQTGCMSQAAVWPMGCHDMDVSLCQHTHPS
jgi:hypothetical protein